MPRLDPNFEVRCGSADRFWLVDRDAQASLSIVVLFSFVFCGDSGAVPEYVEGATSSLTALHTVAKFCCIPSLLLLLLLLCGDYDLTAALLFLVGCAFCCGGNASTGHDLQPLRPAPAQPSAFRDDVMLLQAPVRLRGRTGEQQMWPRDT